MAGDSLANTLSFLATQMGAQRPIPAAPQSFLDSARNPNIRNHAPGQEPQFESPILQMLMGGAGQNAGKGIGQSLALQQQPQGGAGGSLIDAMGLKGIQDAMQGRAGQLEQILNQAGAQ